MLVSSTMFLWDSRFESFSPCKLARREGRLLFIESRSKGLSRPKLADKSVCLFMLEQKQLKHGEILHAWGGNSRLGRANLHIVGRLDSVVKTIERKAS